MALVTFVLLCLGAISFSKCDETISTVSVITPEFKPEDIDHAEWLNSCMFLYASTMERIGFLQNEVESLPEGVDRSHAKNALEGYSRSTLTLLDACEKLKELPELDEYKESAENFKTLNDLKEATGELGIMSVYLYFDTFKRRLDTELELKEAKSKVDGYYSLIDYALSSLRYDFYVDGFITSFSAVAAVLPLIATSYYIIS